jgi:hypothetical protein
VKLSSPFSFPICRQEKTKSNVGPGHVALAFRRAPA